MLCGQKCGSADFWPHSMPRNPRNSNPKLCECDFAKVAHSRARPLCFSIRFSRLFTVHCPPSFSWAGISILARKVTTCLANLELIVSARARSAVGPPSCGEFSGTGVVFNPHAWFFLSPTKTSRSAFNVSTAAGPITSCFNFPMLQLRGYEGLSCCVERCTGLAPQIPPGLAPPVTDRQRRRGSRALEFDADEWQTRTLGGSTTS